MAKHAFGLKKVQMGALGAGGTMGVDLRAVGETVSGTCNLTTDDNQTTDFNIEESDSPVETVVTQQGKMSLAWSSYDISAAQMYKFFGGVYTPFKTVLTVGVPTGGTSYANGTYYDVPLTGGAGSGAKATIVVSGGAVTSVTIIEGGEGYVVGNSLSAATSDIGGGAGSGFTVAVATVGNNSATQSTWEAPDQIPDLEQSLQLTDKKGNLVQIPRAKVTGKFNVSFAKDKLGQLDLVATILQPTGAGVKRLKVIYA
jgi:hypothetical protein